MKITKEDLIIEDTRFLIYICSTIEMNWYVKFKTVVTEPNIRIVEAYLTYDDREQFYETMEEAVELGLKDLKDGKYVIAY